MIQTRELGRVNVSQFGDYATVVGVTCWRIGRLCRGIWTSWIDGLLVWGSDGSWPWVTTMPRDTTGFRKDAWWKRTQRCWPEPAVSSGSQEGQGHPGLDLNSVSSRITSVTISMYSLRHQGAGVSPEKGNQSTGLIKRRESWRCLAWRMGTWENFTALQNYIKGDCSQVSVSLLPQVTNNRMRENGLRLHQEKFRLDTRKISSLKELSK